MKPKSNTFLLLSGIFGSIVSVLVLLGLVLSMIGLSAVPSIIDKFQESFISPAYGATAGYGTTVFGSDSGYIIEPGGVDDLFSDESISIEDAFGVQDPSVTADDINEYIDEHADDLINISLRFTMVIVIIGLVVTVRLIVGTILIFAAWRTNSRKQAIAGSVLMTIYTVLSFNLLALVAVIFAWIGTAKVLKGEVPNEA